MAAVAPVMPLWADTWTDPDTGYTWTYCINGDEAEIYTGYVAAISPYPAGSLTIPSALGGKPVTRIGAYAFYGCSGLTSVAIPGSVTSIGDEAFSGCSGLTAVHITDLAAWCGILFDGFSYANPLYYAHNLYLNGSLVTDLTIPDGVTSIEGYAFSGCSSLTSVTIPDSVTSIGSGAFSSCSGLTNVTIGAGVTSIGGSVFYDCSGLTNVMIGAGVTSIGSSAFSRCGLTSVMIPDSVTSIGSYAFYNCSGLTNVTIGAGVTSIGGSVFYGTPFYDNQPDGLVIFGRVLYELKGTCSAEVTIPEGVTSIRSSVFSGCSDLMRVTIPDSVTSIGESAFDNCTNLTSVTIGNGVMNIGSSAFSGCIELTNVTIPNSVTNIGDSAFSGTAFYNNQSDGLVVFGRVAYMMKGTCPASVTIPAGVTSIGSSAFYGCSGLTSVTIPESVTSIGSSAFYGCSGLTSVTIPDGVTSIGSSAFYGCNSIEYLKVPFVPDGIDDKAAGLLSFFGSFYCYGDYSECVYMDGDVPASLRRVVVDGDVGDSAFSGCSGLTSVTIPDSVTSIGRYAFSGCSGLASVTIPDGVTSIGRYAFSGCSSLTSVTIPDSVTSIGACAFYGCSGLTSVTIPDSVTSIEGYAFSGCSSLTSVTIPDSVTSIGSGAFSSCSGLTNVTIGAGVTSIGSSAFYGTPFYDNQPDGLVIFGRILYKQKGTCPASVTIPDGVTSIGSSAFNGCSGLTSVTIPGSVTSIGSGAFSGCSGLTSVTIPAGVTSIGGSAFEGCSGLTSMTIPPSVMSIGSWAFRSCSSLKEVCVSERLREWLNGAAFHVFYGCAGDLEIGYYDDEFLRVLRECLTTRDGGEAHIELVATNACHVAFEWKCSCEPMRKSRMRDYLSFSIDGVQQDAICGEVGWTNCEYFVEGNGEHVLRWTYQKDDSGSEGEDCGWIRLVTVAPPVTLSFLPGGAESGEPPEAMSFYADAGTVSLPDRGTLAWPKHAFLGWSDGETVWYASSAYPCNAEATALTAAWARKELAAPTIDAPAEFLVGETATITMSAEAGTDIYYTIDGSSPTTNSLLYAGSFTINATTTIRAIAVMDDYFDSPGTTKTVTRDDTTFGGAANAPALEFATDSASGWRRVKGESPDGYALRSGVIGHSATSRLETVVVGDGRITFTCKVAGEVVKGEVYDGLAFLIDGVPQGGLMGNTDWETNTFNVAGEGSHTLSWLYVKDESDEEALPDDCAWIDEVVWTSLRLVTVSFDANGGEVAEVSRRLTVNTALGEPPVPSKTDYTFLGWFTLVSGGAQVTATTPITDNVTLYAHWARIVRTISFDANGGVATPDDLQVESGEAAGAMPIPMRNDYLFLGWFTLAEGGDEVTAETPITADMTLYAHWQCRFAFDGGVWTQQADGSWESSATDDDTTNSFSMTVAGPGTVAFRWKTSCEGYFVFKGVSIRQDGLSFFVDGEEMAFTNGVMSAWAECSFEIEETGAHTLEWAYVKDESGFDGEDCVWVSGVVWTPAGGSGNVTVDVGGGKTVTVPQSWLSENTERAATDVAANGRKVWECYVVGLDPEDTTNDFRIVSFPMKADGTPDISAIAFDPPEAKWNVQGATPVLKGKTTLEGTGEWQTVTDENKADMRFFKVEVVLP